MSGGTGNPLDAVAALMLERQRLEQWLAGMDAKRAITPAHVYERVKGDYERRLAEVTGQLAGRSGEVQATIAALTERLARLQTEETALRDERYESELRAAVGEFTPDQWQHFIRDSDARITRVVNERSTLSSELARLHQILSMAGPPKAGVLPNLPPGAPGAAPADGKRGFDELEFLKSVVGKERPLEGLPIISPGPAPGSNGVPAPAAATLPSPAPSAPAQPRPAAEKLSEEAARAEEEAPVPSFLKDVQEPKKTLRCFDCGTMNFATEWYCERCGGELAAM